MFIDGAKNANAAAIDGKDAVTLGSSANRFITFGCVFPVVLICGSVEIHALHPKSDPRGAYGAGGPWTNAQAGLSPASGNEFWF